MGFLGQQYILPQEQYQQPQSPAMRGPSKAQEAYGEGLLGLEEDVQGYYRDYNAVNQFAHGMWQNYGIDVTAPDPANPTSVQAYDMYLQGMSQVQERGNRMKNRQDLFKAGYQESLKSPDVRFAQGMTPETFDASQDIANVGMTGLTKGLGDQFTKSVKSTEELAQLNSAKRNALEQLDAEYEAAEGDKRLQLEIEKQRQAIRSMTPTYDPTFDKKLASDEIVEAMKLRYKKDSRKYYATSRWEEINRAKVGDVSWMKSLTDKEGNLVWESVDYNPAEQKIYLQTEKGKKPVEIRLDVQDGGARQIHQLLEKSMPQEGKDGMNWSELQNLGDPDIIAISSKKRTNKYQYNDGIDEMHKYLITPDLARSGETYDQLNSIAANGKLIMPSTEYTGISKDIGNPYGRNITSIEYDKHRNPNKDKIKISFAGEIVDPDSQRKQTIQTTEEIEIDPNTREGKTYLKSLLRANSGKINFASASKSFTDNVSYQTPAGKTAMWNDEGGISFVDNDKVNEFRGMGFKEVNPYPNK